MKKQVWISLPLATLLAACGGATRPSPKTAAAPKPQTPAKAVYLEPEREVNPAAVKSPERHDNPNEAAAFHLLQRTGDPNGDLPAERYLAARRKIENGKRPLPAVQSRTSLGQWISLGPGNIGGRTRSLLIDPRDPNVMYAGAVTGGIWKTMDGGANWTPMADLLPSIGIGALAMDPKNPDVLYAGTGEWYTSGSTRGNTIRGLGIFKSTDAGVNWTQLPATAISSFNFTNKMAVSPLDSNRVYAATFGGVWRSLDAGATWSRVLNRTTPNNGCQDLVIRTDAEADQIFAACGSTVNSPTGIFRSLDGGDSWEMVFTTAHMGRTSIALAPSNQNVIYAMAASIEPGSDYRFGLLGIWRSTEGGAPGTWEMRTSNRDPVRINTTQLSNPRELFRDICSGLDRGFFNQGDYDNVIAVDPADSDIVWTGGIDLMRSDDGGRNWGMASYWDGSAPMMSHADHHVLVFHPNYDGNRNQILFNANDGGLYRTSNARAPVATGNRAPCRPYSTSVEWQPLNNSYAVTQFYKGAVYPGGSLYFGGTQDNGTLRGSDATGPNRWVSIRGGDGGFVAVDPTNPNILYHSYTNLSIGKATTGSTAFSTITSGITEPSSNFLFIAPFVLDPSDSQRLYIGGRTLWRTSNGGARWSAASTPFSPAQGSISSIAVSPSDPSKVLYATSQGFIYRTSADATQSTSETQWDFARPRPGFVSSLAFHPKDPNTAYATFSQFKLLPSDQHVYVTTDGGATWRGIDGEGDDSVPDIPVFDIVPDPENPSTLFLGTDIGLFVSNNGGESWSRDQNPFANSVTTSVKIDRSRGVTDLYAFTMGRGVFRTTLPGSGTPCAYRVSGPSGNIEAIGETRDIDVETAPGCVWAAAPESTAVTIANPAMGTGSGRLRITLGLNNGAAARTTAVQAQGVRVALTQNGPLAAANNDEPSTAQPIERLPYVAAQDTREFTTSPRDPIASCAPSGVQRTSWFVYRADFTGTLEIGFQLSALDRFGDIGGFISAHPGSESGPGAATLACLVTPPSTASLTTRRARFPVTEGSTYFIQAGAVGPTPDGGRLVLLAQRIP